MNKRFVSDQDFLLVHKAAVSKNKRNWGPWQYEKTIPMI